MEKVLAIYEKDNEVPFTMRFMEMPSQNDVLSKAATSYITGTLTTDSGPNSVPDDGQVTSSDSD